MRPEATPTPAEGQKTDRASPSTDTPWEDSRKIPGKSLFVLHIFYPRFGDSPPSCAPSTWSPMSPVQKEILSAEVHALLRQGIIIRREYELGGFVSPVFTTLSTQTSSHSPTCSTRNTSAPQEAGPFGAAFTRGSRADLAVPEATNTLIQDSWRASMRSQYDSVLRGWGSFCLERQTNPTLPAIADVLAYLTSLHEAGLQYYVHSSQCTLRNPGTYLGWPDSQTILLSRGF